MAVYDEEKTKLFPGGRLVPGSGAEKVANAISGFKARYQASQDRVAAYMDAERQKGEARIAPRPVANAAAPARAPAAPAPAKAPSQAMTLDEASRREVAARQGATPPGRPNGVGAPTPAGGGSALRPDDPNTFTYSDGRTVAVPKQTAPAMTGQPVAMRPVVQMQGRPAPAVASTFGQSVITMPNDNVVAPRSASRPTPTGGMTLPEGGAFRGADQMAEQYNSREDRELRKAALSNLDSERFRLSMIAGNPGRRGRAATEALGENARAQAALVGEGERLSADAVQNRAANANRLAQTGMEQQGATLRTGMEQQGADQRQELDLANALGLEDMRQAGETERTRIAQRPEARGTELSADAIAKTYSEQLAAIQGGLGTPEEKAAAMQELDAGPLGQRYQQLLAGGGSAASAGATPTWEQFEAKAKQANPGASVEELRAYYNQTYGSR